MKKSSKVVSLLLALLMVISSFACIASVSASAADETTDTKIYFKVPDFWGTEVHVFCHLYSVYGGSPLTETSWQSRKERCKKVSDGLYYFDTATLGTIDEGADYGVIFCIDREDGTESQTCDITMTKSCLGDTVVVDPGSDGNGILIENTSDSQKFNYVANWESAENAAIHGAKASITSTGKVVPSSSQTKVVFPFYQPKAQQLSQALKQYLLNPINEGYFKLENNLAICEILGVTPQEVYDQYVLDYSEDIEAGDTTIPSLELVAERLGVDPTASTEESTEASTEESTEASTETEPTEASTETEPTEASTETEPTEASTETEPTEASTETEPTEASTETEPTEASTETEPTTAPVEESVFVVAGTSNLCIENWNGSPESGNIMTINEDGIYSLTFEDVDAIGEVQIKVVENKADGTQTWIGYPGDANVAAVVASACDVTVTYNPTTGEIAITGDGVTDKEFEVESLRAVGNGDGNWLNGVNWDPADDANLMEETSEGVYEITFTDVEEYDRYQIKFAANGSWNDNWGGVYADSGVESDAVYNSSDNITVVVPYETAEVKVVVDLSNFDYATKEGAKFTITVTDSSTPLTYLYGDVNMDGRISIEDASLAQKYAVGLGTFTDEQITLADVNGDGKISVRDAVMIQKYIANMENIGLTGSYSEIVVAD